MKKLIATLLSMILLIAAVAVGIFTLPASAATRGTIGSCTWTLEGTHLTISGNGLMGYNWGELSENEYDYPWGYDITSVTIEEGVTNICDSAFYGRYNLTSVTIPNSVTAIGLNAFEYCTRLTSVTIPDSVTTIHWEAFANCTNLTSVTIGNGANFDIGTFYGCTCLTEIVVGENNPNYCSENGVLFNKEKTTLMQYPAGRSGSYIIPDGVTAIDWNAFTNCTNLTAVTIPESVTTIGNNAFSGCTNLTYVWQRGETRIVIGSNNSELDKAKWYNNACIESATHTYDSVCDDTCDVCGDIREAHQTWPCIDYCLLCKASMPVTGNHVYTNDCDTDCNYCSAKRPPVHKAMPYSVENDLYFPFALNNGVYSSTNHGDLSSATITLTALYSGRLPIRYKTSTEGSVAYKDILIIEHNDRFLMNASGDTKWTDISIPVEPGDKIYITYSKNHAYSDGYDTVYFKINTSAVPVEDIAPSCEDVICVVCGKIAKTADGHTYSNTCDTSCNTCGAKRTIKHTYTNACDTKCNVCSATRTIKHSYNAATCTKAKTCKVCKITSGKALGHKYTNACDTSCNTCKATRKITHKYTNACDTSCNVCKATRKITHKYTTVTKKATTTANGYTVKRCSVCKKETGKITIYKASSIKLSKTTYVYNGKAQKPTVTIKDSKGQKIATSNYTVTYATGRKNVGTYKVTIKFKGKYSGTKTLTFKINPAGTTVKSLTAGTKKLTVAITKKTAQVTGYQIQYSTSKSFKTVKSKTLTSYKTVSTALTGLKAKTTYYVRVRTYKTVNGVKYYSGWSTIKYKKSK